MIQSFMDDFQINNEERIPASPGQVLLRCEDDYSINEKLIKKYQSGVGKLLHMMRLSQPDILNAVRELSKHMINCNESHLKAMYKVMAYAS